MRVLLDSCINNLSNDESCVFINQVLTIMTRVFCFFFLACIFGKRLATTYRSEGNGVLNQISSTRFLFFYMDSLIVKGG